jgi:hypothetical protein
MRETSDDSNDGVNTSNTDSNKQSVQRQRTAKQRRNKQVIQHFTYCSSCVIVCTVLLLRFGCQAAVALTWLYVHFASALTIFD